MDLNKKLYQNGGWAALYKSVIGRKNTHLEKIGVVYIDRNACIVQSTSNMIAHDAVKNGLYESIWDFLITTSTVTCVSDALDLHIDEPKSNPILKGNKGFVETRVLIPIQFFIFFKYKTSTFRKRWWWSWGFYCKLNRPLS